MNLRARLDATDTATVLRRGLLGLTALGIVGTTVELVFLRHWGSRAELIVWPVMLILALGWIAIVRRPSARVVRAVRVIAVVAALFAFVGVGFHVRENLNAGPLDRFYAARWDTMSAFEQWFAALTGSVGPAPILAPGVLLEMGLGLLLATIRHPALEG
jgi:hypothetical protein